MEWIEGSSTKNPRSPANRRLIIYADGGARGNPGPAGVGAVIRNDDGYVVARISEYIGKATNNQAEYQALILSMQEALDRRAKVVHVHMDSELVVKQMKGEYRVKNDNIKPLSNIVKDLVTKFDEVRFIHVPRTENDEADALVNKAINLGA